MNSPDTGIALKLRHPCGQPVTAVEEMVGYCAMFRYLVDGEAVRYCPRCGKRIWLAHLQRREPLCAESANFLDVALTDHHDTLSSIRATW